MLRKALYNYSGRLPCRLIHSQGKRYLERYYLGQLFGFTFYLHRFVGSDGDRALHDHPWKTAGAICLAGGYLERRIRWFNPRTGYDTRDRIIRPGWLNMIRAATFHQILSTDADTWTLFFHTPKIKEWGFMEIIDHEDEQGRQRLLPHYYGDTDSSSHRQWWQYVPKGSEADRAPLLKR